jgi:hypothetical protein
MMPCPRKSTKSLMGESKDNERKQLAIYSQGSTSSRLLNSRRCWYSVRRQHQKSSERSQGRASRINAPCRAKLLNFVNLCAHLFASLGRGPKEAESELSTSEGMQCHRSAGLAFSPLAQVNPQGCFSYCDNACVPLQRADAATFGVVLADEHPQSSRACVYR